jgi:hypothetical protein
LTVQLEWRDLEKFSCNASPFLNVQRTIGDAMDFTDRYKRK